MKSPVVLAFAGGIHASAAIPWLVDTMGVEVVTVTLDVGQGNELGELRARALACGAVRAHVVDARDDFAREVLFPSLAAAATTDVPRSITSLPWPLIARKLVEIARIENANADHRRRSRVDHARCRSHLVRARPSSAAASSVG
jgi:argininosuccinate synthase